MSAKPFHLAWFMDFTPGEWDHPPAIGGAPWSGEFYVDMAKALKRAYGSGANCVVRRY
jgi:hypothetical protein